MEQSHKVIFVDRCVCCKILLVIFFFLLSLLAIAVVGYLAMMASTASSQAMALSFFISIFNGLGPLNFLRVALNASKAPVIAMEFEGDEENGEITQSMGCCASTWLAPDAVQIMRDLLMVQQIQDSSFVGVQSDEKASKRSKKPKVDD